MPKTSKEGYQILIYRLVDTDPGKLNFAEAVKSFCMFNDYRISVDGLTEGYVVVFDMKGIRLGHLTRIQFGALKTFMAYIQVGYLFEISISQLLLLFILCLLLLGSSSGTLEKSVHC